MRLTFLLLTLLALTACRTEVAVTQAHLAQATRDCAEHGGVTDMAAHTGYRPGVYVACKDGTTVVLPVRLAAQ